MSDPTHAIRIHETGGLSEVLTWEEVDAAQAHLDLEARKDDRLDGADGSLTIASVGDGMRRLTVRSKRRFAFRAAAIVCWICAAGCRGSAPPSDPETPSPASIEHWSDGLNAHRPAVAGPNGLVSAGHPLASIAGIRVLMQGGSAADAAVAILATLNQVEPMMSGIGGNGFVTVYDQQSDQVYSLNATGAAPRALDATTLDPKDLARGTKAGVVPGLFGGWIVLLERFGTMSLGDVLELAIDYAEHGHPLDPFVTDSIDRHRDLFTLPASPLAMFLREGEPPPAGTLVTFPDLARTLRKLVEAEDSARAKWSITHRVAAGRVRSVLQGRHRATDGALL